MSTPHPKTSLNPIPTPTKGGSERIYSQEGLGSAAPTEYSSLLESASGKVIQNDEGVAAAKALVDASLRDSDDQILHLHEQRQLELSAQSQELSKTNARLEEDRRLLEVARFEAQAKAEERERELAAVDPL